MTVLADFHFVQFTQQTPSMVQGWAEAFCEGTYAYSTIQPPGWTITACRDGGAPAAVQAECSFCGFCLVTLTANSSAYYVTDIPGTTTTTPAPTTTTTDPSSATTSVLATPAPTTTSPPSTTTSVLATPAPSPTCTVDGVAASSTCNGTDYFTCTNGTWALAQANSTLCGYVTPVTTPAPITTTPAPTTTSPAPTPVSPTSTCTENMTVCSGTTLYICSNGGWVQVEQNSTTCGYVAPSQGAAGGSNLIAGIDNTTLMYLGIGAIAVIGLLAFTGGHKRGSIPTPAAAPPTPK